MARKSHLTRLCLGCGCDLRGLPENRCPECGWGFDPDNPDTYAMDGARSGRRFLWLALAGSSLTGMSIMLIDVAVIPGTGVPRWCAWLGLALMGIGAVATGYVFQAALRCLRRQGQVVTNRGCAVAAVLITCFVLVGLGRILLQVLLHL
jgi:hypothetical protein